MNAQSKRNLGCAPWINEEKSSDENISQTDEDRKMVVVKTEGVGMAGTEMEVNLVKKLHSWLVPFPKSK